MSFVCFNNLITFLTWKCKSATNIKVYQQHYGSVVVKSVYGMWLKLNQNEICLEISKSFTYYLHFQMENFCDEVWTWIDELWNEKVSLKNLWVISYFLIFLFSLVIVVYSKNFNFNFIKVFSKSERVKSFHEAIGPVVLLGQPFGLLPVTGFLHPNTSRLRFNIYSPISIYSLVLQIVYVLELGLLFKFMSSFGFQFHMIGNFKLRLSYNVNKSLFHN